MPPVWRHPSRQAAAPGQEYDARRGSARARGYDAQWTRESKDFIAADPFCEYCALDGIVRAATLVDHLFPHRGDRRVFWFKGWWVRSCKGCHDGFKQRIERAGRAAIAALAVQLGRPVELPAPRGGLKV